MKKKSWAAAAALTITIGAAQAALIDRGGGMIYDTALNLTWLADTNYAYTSGYSAGGVAPDTVYAADAVWSDGRMGWLAAVLWADALVYGGYGDWRLPTLNPSDPTCYGSGFGCTSGELSHLFVEDLGNKGGESVLFQAGDTAEQIANLALFKNVQHGGYWSGTVYAPDPRMAWDFGTNFGSQGYNFKREGFFALAVRSGDVASPVSEPHALALAMTALAATAMVRGRRPRRGLPASGPGRPD